MRVLLLLLSTSSILALPLTGEWLRDEGDDLPERMPIHFTSAKFKYEKENDVDVLSPAPAASEILQVDMLCQFCLAAIEKLKERQESESNFEENLRKECETAYNKTSETACNLINSANLETLREDSAALICTEQKLCSDFEGMGEGIEGGAAQVPSADQSKASERGDFDKENSKTLLDRVKKRRSSGERERTHQNFGNRTGTGSIFPDSEPTFELYNDC
ncbi:unnamed protein product [Caenorhabditis auriculariae]|uniref:Saposin B-type domain-containing protein n=1 Tax=Caenorhabditis auriculariae TaxID=2777116 RepID=A0A8S1HGP4_9PELO|nr:unnamed protein product [Caenorhabditis auriculariae]